jgi:outer membrane protein
MPMKRPYPATHAILLLLPILLALATAPGAATAQGIANLKVGVVNLNAALNRSAAGERSKGILLASKGQLENQLKAREEALKNKREALKNNIMLTEGARAQREEELRGEELDLRREVQKAQQELQDRERKLTESIFIELKTVIEQIAQEEKFDLILEQNASQVILFSSAKFEDVTEKVIERYNKFQVGK